MKRRRVLLLLESGTDIRSFSYSGLAAGLSGTHDVLFSVRSDRTAQLFDGCGRRVGEGMADLAVPPALRLAMRLAGRIRRDRSDEVWFNFLNTLRGEQDPVRRAARRILRMPGLSHAILAAEGPMIAHWPANRDWRAFLLRERVDAIVCSTLRGRGAEAIRTARSCGIRTVLIENSWKDAFQDSRLDLLPDAVVSPHPDSRARRLAANETVPEDRFIVLPSLHSLAVRRATAPDRAAFAAGVGLDPARPIVCYTAAAPLTTRDEREIVHWLLQDLAADRDPPQVLIRTNPMEGDREGWRGIVEDFPFAALQHPRWEWDEATLWCLPLPEDAAHWKGALLHSVCNVSIASTVTQEFLAFGKPVSNVCFDTRAGIPVDQGNRRSYDAPFYRIYRGVRGVFPAESPEALVDIVRRLATEPQGLVPEPQEPGLLDSYLRLIVGDPLGGRRDRASAGTAGLHGLRRDGRTGRRY